MTATDQNLPGLNLPGTGGGKTAVIAVDVQNDFCPGGALPVPGGDQVVPLVNRLLAWADLRCATKDWHAPDDPSFTENGGGWPRHCVVMTVGARLHPDLVLDRERDYVFLKQGYSAFSETSGSLERILRRHNITRVVVCGLALDYCVKATALDARKLGFRVFVAIDATRAVNPRSIPDLCDELTLQGIVPCHAEDLLPAPEKEVSTR